MGRKEFNDLMKALMHRKHEIQRLSGNHHLFRMKKKAEILLDLENQMHNLRKGVQTELIDLTV